MTPLNWGVFRRSDGTYHEVFIPFSEDDSGDLMSRWPSKMAAKECAEQMAEMANRDAALEAGQRDLFEEE